VAAVVAAAVVVLSGVRIWSSLVQQTSSADDGYRRPVRSLIVDAAGADVVLGAAADGRMTVHQSLVWTFRRPAVRQTWSGDTLTVRARCRSAERWALARDCGMRLAIAVPAGTAVTYRGTSGSLRASALSGPLRLSADSEQITLAGVRGTVDARVGSGSIAGTGLTASRVGARAESGTVALDFAAPPAAVSAQAGSGSVEVTVPPATRYRITGSGASGGIDVTPRSIDDASAARRIDASARAGSVRIAYRAST
jgi:hypothetical protein